MSQITISNLHKHFGPVKVLRGIDLVIPQGSVLALLGPSGCGKTTLLRLIAGFERVEQGSIHFADRQMAGAGCFVPPEERHIGYVPQEGSLFPHLTVEGNIAFGIPRQNSRRQRIDEVLELTGLQGFGKRYPHELSGGQQQRVALARALAPDPALVLLDEPFNALDLDLRRSLCEDVTGVLRQTGTTTILVTHDPGEAYAASDQLAVMMSGQIRQSAPPESVYWQPANAEVARLTGAAIFVPGHLLDGWVECCLGRLPVHASSVPLQGDVTVMVRPEQFLWTAAVDGGVSARVTHRSFRGDHTMVELELGDMCISLRMPSLQAPQQDEQGAICIAGKVMVYAGI